jgi:RNA polymerase sigma factor (sigma-70 family)
MLDTQTLYRKSILGGSPLADVCGHGPKTQRPKMRAALPASPQTIDWSKQIMRVRSHRDEAAFAALFNHFAPRIKGFLIKSGAPAPLAEECTQETMVTLWNKAHLFDPSRASAATWIFTIARNKKIDAFRRAARPEPEDLSWGPEAQPDISDVLVLQEETQRLALALEALPQSQRDMVKRAFYGELSHAELAQETGLPLGTIKSRIRLAIERLRQTLSEKQ